MGRIDIGFVEECDSWRLESRFFPSKIGGKPAWLNLKDLPCGKDVECGFCKNPSVFLCQIYAPYEEPTEAFHRTLYIFVCKNESCCKVSDSSNIKVLRCQLPRENAFYPSEPPEEREDWRNDIDANKWVKTCRVCGILAPSRCAKCRSTSYCGRTHQVLDWKSGHKQRCNAEQSSGGNDTSTTAVGSNSVLFPEYELVKETEIEDEDDEDDLAKEQEEMVRFESLVKSGKAGTLQTENDVDTDLDSMSRVEQDETFTNFSEKMRKHPDQVLRYDRGGKPLYISSFGQPQDVPKCVNCNGDRQFEFQIMPQLLNYLNFDDVLKSFDWGTLLIYTCRNSCVPKSGYVAEYIWKQDIVEKTPEIAETNEEKFTVTSTVNQ